MNEETFKPILDTVGTRTQSQELLMQIEGLLQSLFDTSSTINEKLSRFLSHDFKEKLVICFEKGSVSLDDTTSVEKFLQKLIEVIRSVKVVDFHIAFSPKDSQILSISSWFTSNFKSKVFLDVFVDKNLVGGISIGYNGVFYEYSLRKRLEEKFKLGEFSSLLKER